jgi:uncharacterized protein (TIGR02271 family)
VSGLGDVSTGRAGDLTGDLARDTAPFVASSGATTTRGAEADADFYGDRHYDDARLFPRGDAMAGLGAAAAAAAAAADAAADLIVRSDEELAIGRREVDAGDVGVRKIVETERVIERLPVTRQDVDIERRALRPGEELLAPDVRDDEIRIPIMAEELVVEKRLVTKEVLIIRKRAVTEERVVEADLRRERVEIDDPARRVVGVDPSPSAADAGPV